jgi:signal transduction histidine kinase
VPLLGEVCLIDLIDDQGNIRHAAVAHADAGMPMQAEALRGLAIPSGGAEHLTTHVVRTGEPHIHELGGASLIVAPMIARGKAFGAVYCLARTGGRSASGDLHVVVDLARRAALAVDNARLYAEARNAEQELRELNEALEQRVLDRTAELEVAGRHKSDFLASMSHELRTPLNAIIGFSELMLDHDIAEISVEQRNTFLDHIQTSGHHLLGLVNDILDLSKVEAGQMELKFEPVVIGQLIADCTSMMRVVADSKGLTLEASSDPPGALVTLDKARVKQILLNLLSNAVNFTPPDGHISLTCTVGTQEAVVAVRDTGIGIKLEEQELIFQKFRQTTTHASQVEGTGLGLTLVRTLVELHGGRIQVDSTPGQGSCFTFSIPRRSPAVLPDRLATVVAGTHGRGIWTVRVGGDEQEGDQQQQGG